VQELPEDTDRTREASMGPDTTIADTRRRILIVDDHPLVRAGMAALIQAEPDLAVCGEAATASEALACFRECTPDAVVLDLSLADCSGLGLLKRLAKSAPRTPILVCSMHEESLFAQRALNAGASGYIHKQEATTHVIEAIRQVLSGRIYLSEQESDRALRRGASAPESGHPRASVQGLSDRELEVFNLIGQCQSASQIAEQLHLSVKTIETHRAKIKRKLGLATGSELTRYAVQWALEQR